MSTKLKEILTKNGPYPTTLNPNISQAKADPGLAPAMFTCLTLEMTLEFCLGKHCAGFKGNHPKKSQKVGSKLKPRPWTLAYLHLISPR